MYTLTIFILLISFFTMLALSVPVSYSILIASVITIFTVLPLDLSLVVASQKILTGMDSFSLLAVPFFILAGVLMNNGGIALRLVNLAKVVVGRVPGALVHTNIMGNAFFGMISGSSVAATIAIGGTMLPIAKKEGYDPKFAAAANIASAPTGLIIPPSGILVIYAVISNSSVVAMIMAGYLPGLLWMFSCMVLAYFISRKHGYFSNEKVSFSLALKTFIDAVPSLFLIVIIIGGIVSGVFTPTEASAVAVAYAFILSFFVYRSIKFAQLPKILVDSCMMTTIIMFLIGASSVMSFVMSFTGLPAFIGNSILAVSENPIIILLIINIILLIVGTFMDLTPAVLIFAPIFLPVVKSFGMDPIHFGIMMIANLSFGNITPPVGNSLYSGCSVAGLEVEDVMKPLLPFYAVIIITIMIITYIPDIALFLPRLTGVMK